MKSLSFFRKLRSSVLWDTRWSLQGWNTSKYTDTQKPHLRNTELCFKSITIVINKQTSIIHSNTSRACLDWGTFFKVTTIFGAVTLHGMIISLPTVMCIILGISLCISTNGLLVSTRKKNKGLLSEILRQCMEIVTVLTAMKEQTNPVHNES